MVTSHSNDNIKKYKPYVSAREFYDQTGTVKADRIQTTLKITLLRNIPCSTCEELGWNTGCIDRNKCADMLFEKMKDYFESIRQQV